MLSREDDSTHLANGSGNEAHYVRSTIYGGRTVTVKLLGVLKLGMKLDPIRGEVYDRVVGRSDGDCIVGHVESANSHHRTSTIDATLRKLPGDTINTTKDCTGTGLCGKKVGVFVVPDSRSGGRFSLQGVHRVSVSGSEIVNLSATAYYNRP